MMDEISALPDPSLGPDSNRESDSPRVIPDKLFFKMGEVSQLVGVEAYVLRYWESEFKGLSPKKSASGQRMFRRKDVELLLEIKHLLYERKFTIDGARKWLQERPSETVLKRTHVKQVEMFAAADPIPEIRRQVAEIIRLLE
jgi:DNA-binding transcriptional MerR regulator